MRSEVKRENNTIYIIVEGRIDANTAPVLEKDIGSLEEITYAHFDLTKLDYISSAGLRVILNMVKTLQKVNGNVTMKGAKPEIMDIFTMTGMDSLLKFEK